MNTCGHTQSFPVCGPPCCCSSAPCLYLLLLCAPQNNKNLSPPLSLSLFPCCCCRRRCCYGCYWGCCYTQHSDTMEVSWRHIQESFYYFFLSASACLSVCRTETKHAEKTEEKRSCESWRCYSWKD